MRIDARQFIYSSVIWVMLLGSCASETITTWLVKPGPGMPPECLKYVLFNHKTSQANDFLTVEQMILREPRCYSKADDTYIRNQLAECQ